MMSCMEKKPWARVLMCAWGVASLSGCLMGEVDDGYYGGPPLPEAADEKLDPGESVDGADSLAEKSTLPPDGTINTGVIDYSGAIDLWSFYLSSTNHCTIETLLDSSTTLSDSVIELHGPNSSSNLIESNDDGGAGLASLIDRRLGSGTYYVKVKGYGSNTGSYKIRAICKPCGSSDSLGGWTYCTAACPCEINEGDCDYDSDCAPGLRCDHDVGTECSYGDSTLDVCRPPVGDWDYCIGRCKCNAGEGDCDSDSNCTSGLVCVDDVGAEYGYPSTADVCERPPLAATLSCTGGGNTYSCTATATGGCGGYSYQWTVGWNADIYPQGSYAHVYLPGDCSYGTIYGVSVNVSDACGEVVYRSDYVECECNNSGGFDIEQQAPILCQY